MLSWRKVAGVIKSLVNATGLQLECTRVLHEAMFVHFLMYGRETMIWKEKERSSIGAVQTGNLRSLPGIRRMYKVPNARVREMCGWTKRVAERINEGILRWFGHIERMGNDRIAKMGYVGVVQEIVQYVGCSRGGLILYTVNDCLKKIWMSDKRGE